MLTMYGRYSKQPTVGTFINVFKAKNLQMDLSLGQESPKIIEIRARSQKRRKLLNQQVSFEMAKLNEFV